MNQSKEIFIESQKGFSMHKESFANSSQADETAMPIQRKKSKNKSVHLSLYCKLVHLLIRAANSGDYKQRERRGREEPRVDNGEVAELAVEREEFPLLLQA